MSKRRSVRILSAAQWAVPIVLLVLPTAVWAVCTNANNVVQQTPTLMLQPGQMAMQPGCCPGPCMCIPNVRYWGYYPRQWQQWPGDELRPDIRFPDGRGIEGIPTPAGEKPEKLPKEEYAPLETETGQGINTGGGTETGPVTTPGLPFDFQPGFNQELPGLPLEPQGTVPGLPSAVPGEPSQEEDEKESEPTLPGLPPAPSPEGNSQSPHVPGALPNLDDTTPSALAADPLSQEMPSLALANSPLSKEVTPIEWEEPLAPLPFESIAPSSLHTPSQIAGTPPAVIEPAMEPTSQEALPSELVETMPSENKSAPQLASEESPAEAAPLAPLPSESDSPMAPLPCYESPAVQQPAAPQTAAVTPAKEPWTEPNAWKPRRAQSGLSATRTVDYEEPAKAVTVGLDGYCPVELVRNEQWVEGKQSLAVEFEGRTYLLSGPQQHRLFRANPERYAPVLSGCDPVLAATGNKQITGRTDACVVYQGRLYMFASQATLAQFRQEPDRFIDALARPAE